MNVNLLGAFSLISYTNDNNQRLSIKTNETQIVHIVHDDKIFELFLNSLSMDITKALCFLQSKVLELYWSAVFTLRSDLTFSSISCHKKKSN